ncbi:membrane protein [Kitasatospora sp. MMS16-BH015]|uniref:DUF4307 domain-containing protein n=1 Tax=Kitasatospora sp. MMS16-BH015 TaxID=2018025 RepID=UPI000CA27F4C|nr:DUF4307 domain-containing protein [Kitasatospora sp. MMS16-BH015]AUG79413.1 membrane protein [Kitasatospora sp. MMS16-BH015]
MDSGTRTATTPRPPADRYGRGSDASADRKLKIVGAVCAVLALGLIAWLGGSYLMRETKLRATVQGFEVVSESAIKVQLTVSKSKGVGGVCTVRAQAADGSVVGLSDVPVPAQGGGYDETVTLRTTARSTTAELLGCTPAK